MATLTIPVRNDIYFYRQFVTLDNEEYIMVFDYNQREDSWYLSIEDDVLNGIRLSGNNDILDQYHYLEVPPGELKIVDQDGLGREPNRDNFGDRVILTYDEI
jgi:uncharacterized protein DUF6983